MNILLPIGTRDRIFDLLQENEFIKNFRDLINSKSEENYSRIRNFDSFAYRNIPQTNNALYLFGIEIENNPNKKHLMGDFLNAYMLSINPIVLVPEEKLDATLGLIEFLNTIKNLKGIDFTSLLKVNLLTIKQFKELVNQQLTISNIQPIEIADYE